MRTAKVALSVLGAILLTGMPALAQETKLQSIRVVSIPGRPLPAVVAESHGIFAAYGLDVRIETAPSSDVLRAALAGGKADVAHAAVDNAVAMVEKAGVDVVIVMGGEGSINELIAQPGIHSIQELRGKTVIVDAPNTAYALQLKKILLLKRLRPGRDCELKPVGTTPQRLQAMREHKEYAASIMGPPTSILAKHDGFVSLGATQELIGPYQALGAFVRRSWGSEHADAVVRYLAAYVAGERWLLDPTNKQQVLELLTKEWHLTPAVADETYALMKGHDWYQADARFDVDAFNNVLKLRSEVEGEWGGHPPAPEKYYDPAYYQQAISKLKPR